MALSDELAKLQELHHSGALSDEEYSRAKSRLLDQDDANAGAKSSAPDVVPVLAAINALRRQRGDRWIAGVCGGIARATGVESWVWRLLFAVMLMFGGVGLVLYILLWIFVPSE